MSVIASIVGILIGALFSGLIIWIVGKLGLGIEVDGFRPAYLAAIIIGVLNALTVWIWGLIGFSLEGGWSGALISAIISAGFLQFAGSRIKGLRVKGFGGALIASLAMAAVTWLILWGIGRLF